MASQTHVRRQRKRAPAIVVVAREYSLVDFLDSRLRRRECELVAAQLPTEVLRQLDRRRVSLVVCDDSAPGLRSFQLMSEIKARSPKTRIALIVPSGSPDQEQRAKSAAVDDYLPHAFALKRLGAILDEVFQ